MNDIDSHILIITGCLVDENSTKVSCRICHIASGAQSRTWINRASWKKHLEAPAHLLAIQRTTETQERQADTHRQYNDMYSMPTTSLQTPAFLTTSGASRAHFRPILDDEDTNGVSAADFQDIMMQEVNALHAGVTEPDDFMLKNVEALRREIEILKLQHLEAEFEGADDETVPQFVQEIRDNSKGPS